MPRNNLTRKNFFPLNAMQIWPRTTQLFRSLKHSYEKMQNNNTTLKNKYPPCSHKRSLLESRMPFSLVPDCSKRWPRVFKGRILRSETVKSQANIRGQFIMHDSKCQISLLNFKKTCKWLHFSLESQSTDAFMISCKLLKTATTKKYIVWFLHLHGAYCSFKKLVIQNHPQIRGRCLLTFWKCSLRLWFIFKKKRSWWSKMYLQTITLA